MFHVIIKYNNEFAIWIKINQSLMTSASSESYFQILLHLFIKLIHFWWSISQNHHDIHLIVQMDHTNNQGDSLTCVDLNSSAIWRSSIPTLSQLGPCCGVGSWWITEWSCRSSCCWALGHLLRLLLGGGTGGLLPWGTKSGSPGSWGWGCSGYRSIGPATEGTMRTSQ